MRYVIVLTAVTVIFLLAQADDHRELTVQDRQYCTMVTRYRESGGEHGWPAYRGECE